MAVDWNNTLIVAEYPGHREFVSMLAWDGADDIPTVRFTRDESEAFTMTSQEGDAWMTRLNGCLHEWLDEGHTRAARTTHFLDVQYFATVGVLIPWLATYRDAAKPPGRRTLKPRKPKTLGPYFARSYEAARRYALDVLDREHEGAELIDVTQTTDPRS